MTQFEHITVDDLPEKRFGTEPPANELLEFDANHVLNLQEVEKRYIERVLGLSEGNKMPAARLLGVDRRTL